MATAQKPKLEVVSTPEEIKARVDAFFNDSVFLKLKTKMEKHYDLYRMLPFVPEKGYLGYTSNEPRNQFDKLMALGVNARMRINIPDATMGMPKASAAEQMERFLFGVLDWNDQKFLSMGLPSLRQQMMFVAGLQGTIFHRTFVYKDDEGMTQADVSVWPRYETAFAQGSKGLLWAAHKYDITYERAQEEYNYVKEGAQSTQIIQVIDWWDTKNNGVLLDGQDWGKDLTPHGLDFCPVHRLNVGPCPSISYTTDLESANNQGQSMFETIAGIADPRNRLYSDIMTLVHRAVKRPLVSETHDGEAILNADVMQTNKTAEIPLKLGERIYPLIPQDMPPDTGTMLGILSQENEKAGFSGLSWGQGKSGMSGYAVNLLQAADSSVLLPFMTALNQAYQTMCVSIIKQFGKGSFPKIKVKGRDSKGQTFGYPKLLEIGPKEIDPTWIPIITIEPVFPRDDAQKVQIASMLKQAGLLSLRSIQTDTLGVDDPEAERAQMNREFGFELPTVKLWLSYIAAIDKEDYDLAANILVEAKKMTQMNTPPTEQAGGTNQAAGGALGVPQSPVPNQAFGALQEASMNAGAGIPTDDMGGMDNSSLPPEMMGGLPGGAI